MEFRLNLASRSYLDRRSVRRWLLLVGGVAALLLAVHLAYGYFNLQQLQRVDAHLAEIDARMMAQRSETAVAFTPENLARVKARIVVANQLLADDHFRWSVLLTRLEALLPDDVAVQSLKPNFRDRSLQVTASARDTMALTTLLDSLLTSPDMNQAYLLNQSTAVQPDGGEVVRFSLVIKEAF
jgi:type IV pilus assembly protein PilN